MPLDRASDRPLYQQLADEIRVGIASGESVQLTEGTLAATYGVGRDTVRQALESSVTRG